MPAPPFDQRRSETSTRLAALMLANAFIFQEQLSVWDPRVKSIEALRTEGDFIAATAAHWNMIIAEFNYVPIFMVAREIMISLPNNSDTEASIKDLAERALIMVSKKAALRHDLMGRIYHLLLSEAKYLGTYYTSGPAATLLLKLTLDVDRWPKVNWGDTGSLAEFRIADLACGTGTLLMAASQALTDNFIKFYASISRSIEAETFTNLRKIIIEEVLHGYDVLPSAAHLTASTLALLAPEICFEKMHIYSLPMGKQRSGQVFLGSIEYLSADRIVTQLDLLDPGARGAERVGDDVEESVAPLPPLDVCVMNPPFVRSGGGNLLFGSVDDQRGQMRAELARRIRTANLAASAAAGLGAVFAAIGDRHVKEGGRLALVLPAAVTSGVGWQRTRELINQNYVLETVIASHDPTRWNFSENTELSEVMLIARKRDRAVDTDVSCSLERTQFVSLWINPRTSAHALAIAEQISRSAAAPIGSAVSPRDDISAVRIGRRKYAETLEIPWGEVRTFGWFGAAFARTRLVRAAWMLGQGRFYAAGATTTVAIPMTTVGAIGLLGPDRRDIVDGFAPSESPTDYPSLWGHSGDEMRTMAAEPNGWLAARSAPAHGRKVRRADMLWRRAGMIMIAERSWMHSQRTMAVRLPRPALSNVWWPLRLREANEAAEKALALWFNSTPGILVSLAHRVPTRGGWIHFKKQTIQAMPVLDVLALSPEQTQILESAYDSLASCELGTFADMANDDLRKRIDGVFSQTLGLPDIDDLRRKLSEEPIIALRQIDEEKDTADIEDHLDFELI